MIMNNENQLGYKKIFIVMMLIISICLGSLCGCTTKACETSCESLEYAENVRYIQQKTTASDKPTLIDVTNNVSIIIDMHTGVQYIFYKGANRTGMSPLLDSDGSPILADMDEIKNID